MKKFYLILFFILIAGNISVYRTILAPRVLEVRVFETGEGLPAGRQGTATLVRSPNGKIILVDTGSDASILRALGTALPMWQRHIDVVVLTSTKAIATGGLPDVTHRYATPTPIRFGTVTTPYGARLAFENITLAILAPSTLTVSYGTAFLSISSSTPSAAFISDGKTVTEIK